MFDNLFGVELPLPVKFFLAFVVVLAAIVALTWLVRRFGAARLGAAAARGRQPRLAVIDFASVDSRRRLVLIRRDNVEHLVLIGGPSDVVVEQNIVRAVPVAPPREAPPRHAAEAMQRAPEIAARPEQVARQSHAEAGWAGEPAPRGPRVPEPNWGQPEPPARAPRPEPGWTAQPEPAARLPRAPEPNWSQPEPPARATRPEQTWAPSPEPAARPEPPARPARQAEPAAKAPPPADVPPRALPEPVTAALRGGASPEPARTPPAPKPAVPRLPAAEPEQPVEVRQSPPTADVNLADMAQRLEAALRRPARPEGRDSAARPEAKRAPASEAPRPAAAPSGEPARPQRPAPAREASSREASSREASSREASSREASSREAPSREAPPREAPPRETPPREAPSEPPRAAAPEPTPAPEPAKPAASAEAKPAPAKSVFDSLEEEMANLLGRPPGKP